MAYNTNYGGMASPFLPQYDLNALTNQINMLKQQQQQLQFGNPVQNSMPQVNVMQRGEFVVVNDIKDVENYPAPIDGTPVLIFINGKQIFYNKKFENGNTKCQPNIHQPYNNGEPEKKEEEQKQDGDEMMKLLLNINTRLDKLEKEKTENKRPRQSTKKQDTEVEVSENGI